MSKLADVQCKDAMWILSQDCHYLSPYLLSTSLIPFSAWYTHFRSGFLPVTTADQQNLRVLTCLMQLRVSPDSDMTDGSRERTNHVVLKPAALLFCLTSCSLRETLSWPLRLWFSLSNDLYLQLKRRWCGWVKVFPNWVFPLFPFLCFIMKPPWDVDPQVRQCSVFNWGMDAYMYRFLVCSSWAIVTQQHKLFVSHVCIHTLIAGKSGLQQQANSWAAAAALHHKA